MRRLRSSRVYIIIVGERTPRPREAVRVEKRATPGLQRCAFETQTSSIFTIHKKNTIFFFVQIDSSKVCYRNRSFSIWTICQI